MDAATVETNLARAESLIQEAHKMALKFVDRGERGSYDQVMEQADPIIDRLEEAQQILLETEVDDLPEATTPGEEEEDSPELEVEGEAYDLSMKKQDLEHDSRLLESDVHRAAANLAGEPLDGSGKLDEQQDQLLSARPLRWKLRWAASPTRSPSSSWLRFACCKARSNGPTRRWKWRSRWTPKGLRERGRRRCLNALQAIRT